MKHNDEMFNKLADLMKENKSHLHILEETIPVNEQFEYFNTSKQLRENPGEYTDRNYLVSLIFTAGVPVEEKKRYLSLLAGIPDVGAYRAIETYHSSPLEPELSNWSAMALVESRILLNSDLTGEQQIFVSTGLGGHDGKLRYFIVIASKNSEPFNDFQQGVIEREFSFQFDSLKIEIENIDTEESYISYLVLAEIDIDIRKIVADIVKECNQYGDFIDRRSLITNMKILTKEEIERNIRRSNPRTATDDTSSDN